ncbi:MAG: lytic transglycosylase domain-containing protein [Deltaproteobacteria bacterium]|nr:lytic transglycosylase domain-containing protein [Deltaproteobacteria bacterium]
MAPRAQAALLERNNRQKLDELVGKTARKEGLDPALVKAVVTAESDFDPYAQSGAGAMGLMQLMPETAKDLGVTNPWDPQQNVEAGTRYLKSMLDRFGGDLNRALSAYNWGPNNVEKGGVLPRETREYVAKVLNLRRLYTEGFSTSV